MNGLYHPLSKALYELDEEGSIVVTDGDRSGRFRADGSWIDGELRECDPQLCNWLSGPQFANHRLSKASD